MATYQSDFEARLLYVTRNLVQYGKYGKDLTKAAKIIKGYFKEKSLEECKARVAYFARAYEEGTILVETNLSDYRKPKLPVELVKKEEGFLATHAELSPEILRSMLDWIYLWYQR
jgi:hypothetical protein